MFYTSQNEDVFSDGTYATEASVLPDTSPPLGTASRTSGTPPENNFYGARRLRVYLT